MSCGQAVRQQGTDRWLQSRRGRGFQEGRGARKEAYASAYELIQADGTKLSSWEKIGKAIQVLRL